ncbi:MAG: metallophosphoesterase [Bacteroidales bacterium]|nr:metallophosphoesterase [Bacteroidales bacterium]
MKTFLMFFLIVLCIYAVGNLYLFVRGWQALEIIGRQRVWFAVAFWIAALSFIVSQMLAMKGVAGRWLDASFVVGSFWIAVMLHGFLLLLFIDILRMIGWAGDIRPDFIYRNYPLSKAVIFGSVCLISAVILCFGYRNAHRPKVTHLEIPVDKSAGQLTGLRVVMASDIHLGRINGRKQLARVVDVMNGQRPDLVLLVGDTFDGAPDPVIGKNMGVEFDRLQSVYGVYAVSGNHEYIGTREKRDAVDTAFGYLASHGVQPLQDSVVLMDGSFYVVGRKDRSADARKAIPELLHDVDLQLPVIMLDHQPYHLDRVAHAGIDLQLSGHTHHGQMWPMNYVTRKIYEQDWGFLQKGKSNFYISCGVGTWGPPIRTAGYSEIVVIDLKFNN